MKKAVIIGASSGIGRELAVVLSENNYELALTARRIEKLEELKTHLSNDVLIEFMDVTEVDSTIITLDKLFTSMKTVDLVIISAGVGYLNNSLDWEKDKHTIDTNVVGFTAIVNAVLKYFETQGYGHLVAISSIAANIANAEAASYSASKAYNSWYLAGLTARYNKINKNIIISDVQPGFVDTDMAKGDKMFWVASPQKAAKQIFSAIKNKKKFVYITRRWLIAGLLLRFLHFLHIKI